MKILIADNTREQFCFKDIQPNLKTQGKETRGSINIISKFPRVKSIRGRPGGMGSSIVDLIHAPRLFTVSVTDEIIGNLIPPVDGGVVCTNRKAIVQNKIITTQAWNQATFSMELQQKNKLIQI